MRVAIVIFAIAACLQAAWAPPAAAEEKALVVSYAAGGNAAADSWRARVERARARYERFVADAIQRRLSFSGGVFGSAPKRQAPLTSILDDPTLRPGDIYAATGGFVVFRGQSGDPHQGSDFVPMSEQRAKELSLAIGNAGE